MGLDLRESMDLVVSMSIGVNDARATIGHQSVRRGAVVLQMPHEHARRQRPKRVDLDAILVTPKVLLFFERKLCPFCK